MRAAVFLIFWSGAIRQVEIGHCGRFHHDGRGLQMFEDLVAHLGGGAHGDGFDAAGRGEMHRSGDQHHPRAARGRCLRQRVAHLAAGAVRDVADRVDRLLRGAGGDQHGFAFQVAAFADFELR